MALEGEDLAMSKSFAAVFAQAKRDIDGALRNWGLRAFERTIKLQSAQHDSKWRLEASIRFHFAGRKWCLEFHNTYETFQGLVCGPGNPYGVMEWQVVAPYDVSRIQSGLSFSRVLGALTGDPLDWVCEGEARARLSFEGWEYDGQSPGTPSRVEVTNEPLVVTQG